MILKLGNCSQGPIRWEFLSCGPLLTVFQFVFFLPISYFLKDLLKYKTSQVRVPRGLMAPLSYPWYLGIHAELLYETVPLPSSRSSMCSSFYHVPDLTLFIILFRFLFNRTPLALLFLPIPNTNPHIDPPLHSPQKLHSSKACSLTP